MRIYRMTATFGKLRHETLTLAPGLDIIEAPNEWGKSTWCAFLMAMLYGLDTRSRSTKAALADKDRFAPWSGEPMAGRIDLCWRGRDITIERSTRRRVPLGDFKAYETASGIPVSELTADNCGEWLLGVEQSVYRRAGFIRFSDLPVTQDDALRARLNALVTTGDESGDAERLSGALRDLKNRCRYNKKGLLPQAEDRLTVAQGKLRELEELSQATQSVRQQLDALEEERLAHENHLAALEHQEALADAQRVAQAKEQLTQAEGAFRGCEEACRELPSPEQTLDKLLELETLIRDLSELEAKEPEEAPREPELPELYQVTDPRAMVAEDLERHKSLSRRPLLLWCLSGALALAGGVLAVLKLWIWAIGALGLGALVLALGLVLELGRREKRLSLEQKYGSRDPRAWETPLDEHEQALREHRERSREYEARQEALERTRLALERKREALCGDLSPERAMEVCRQVQSRWEALEEARQELRRCREHHGALKDMARPVPPPVQEDLLTCSREESRGRLARIQEERWSAQNRLGRNQGRMQSLGSREELERETEEIRGRIRVLEDAYAALTIAQETLAQARLELQRRFAPQIVRRAKELMEGLTCGRYDKLSLGEDLALQAGTGEENTLQSILWRSDGTMDQLYLALRLAVAEALAPEAPLILDDALVRFDDERLRAALRVLEQFAKDRQVLVFTCHSREKALLK